MPRTVALEAHGECERLSIETAAVTEASREHFHVGTALGATCSLDEKLGGGASCGDRTREEYRGRPCERGGTA